MNSTKLLRIRTVCCLNFCFSFKIHFDRIFLPCLTTELTTYDIFNLTTNFSLSDPNLKNLKNNQQKKPTVKPASIELEKAKKALISGKTAQFKCSSWGSRPPALVTWHLNDKPLDGAK